MFARESINILFKKITWYCSNCIHKSKNTARKRRCQVLRIYNNRIIVKTSSTFK